MNREASHSHYKVLTAALLIAGNTIGAGMLGFPILTGLAGCVPAVFGVVVVWMIMWVTGYILASRLTLPGRGELGLPSLFQKELGRGGKGVAILGYLINYYGIVVAYLAGATAIAVKLYPAIQGFPTIWVTLIFFIFLTGFTLFGEEVVRHGNFLFMTLLFVSFVALIIMAGHSFDAEKLKYIDWGFFPATIPIIICVFTYHNTIPVACRILDYNRRSVRRALFIGTFLPCVLTVVWTVTVIGSVPLSGPGKDTLLWAFKHNLPATIPMARMIDSPYFLAVSLAFALLAIVTSYVAVGTGLLGFMHDLTRRIIPFRNRATDALLAFGPPLVVTLLYPDLFLIALNVSGGIGVAIVFGLLPGIILIKVSGKRRWIKVVGLCLTLFFCFALLLEVAQETGLLKMHPAAEHWTSPLSHH